MQNLTFRKSLVLAVILISILLMLIVIPNISGNIVKNVDIRITNYIQTPKNYTIDQDFIFFKRNLLDCHNSFTTVNNEATTVGKENPTIRVMYYSSKCRIDRIKFLNNEKNIIVTDKEILNSDKIISYLPYDFIDDTAFCGATEAIDGLPYAQAVLLVHTLKEREDPDEPVKNMNIYHDVFYKDKRDVHPAYIIVPTMDIRKIEKDSEWRYGPGLASLYIPENFKVPRTQFGTYGYMKFNRKDTLFEFRLKLRIYIETKPGEFELFSTATDNGIWFYDVEPAGWDNKLFLNSLFLPLFK